MEKGKRRNRLWMKIISMLLIFTLAVNEVLGNGYAVLASPSNKEAEETLGETENPDETESDFLAEDTPQEVLVAQEDILKRSSHIKYFENEDHTHTAAIYPVPVHFEENGEWKEIDNRLSDAEPDEEEPETEFWGNKQNPFRVKFSKKSNGNKLADIKMDDFGISWKLKDMLKVDARQLDMNESSGLPDALHEEEQEMPEEEPATIFTEVPTASKDSGLSEAEAEAKWGRKLGNKPENNTTEGILPEQQEKWADTNDAQEETIDKAHLDKIKKSNEEKMKVKNLLSGVVYEEIYPNVDIEYRLESQKVKENIILKNTEAQNEFIFQFQINGLNPEQDGRCILFKDGKNETVFEMQPPFLYDAAGECSEKVSLELVRGKGKKCEILITADPEWLQKEDRAFPVVLDPTLETSQDARKIWDTYALSGYPATNYYNRPVLKTGVNGSDGIARSFLKFEMPRLESGDMIIDARLNLYCYSTSDSQVTVAAYAASGDWDSQEVTWDRQPHTQDNMSDYAVFTPKTGDLIQFDVTDIVRSWQEGIQSGIMLKAAKETGQYVEYVSSDFAIEAKDCRPSILLTYVSNSGLEDYWTYHSQSVGRAGTGYVNDYNGNLVFVHDTMSTRGNKMPISLCLVYNTNDRNIDFGYGYGWHLNYHQTLSPKKISDTDYYQYIDGDGTNHYFYYDTEKKEWKDESGIDLKLTIDTASSERYTITDKQDGRLIFGADGKLIRCMDQNGNQLTITYKNGKLSRITDGAGRFASCTYDTSGYLQRIRDSAGESIDCIYQYERLAQIMDPEGETVKYTYDNISNVLTEVENVDGYRIIYNYEETEAFRVCEVKEEAGTVQGQSFQVKRGTNCTEFTDWKGRKETYLFNNCGNTISVKNEQGDAQTSRYLTEGNNKNKISKVSRLQTPVINLLKNSYLETAGEWTAVQSQGTAVIENNSGRALEGNNVMHLQSAQANGKAGFKQSAAVSAGKTYTFSAYVKTDEDSIRQGKCGMQIAVSGNDGKQIRSGETNYYLTENGWYRLLTTLSIPADMGVVQCEASVGVSGTADAYVDCLQFEEAVSASRYNLIENGDFRNRETGYTKNGTGACDTVMNREEAGRAGYVKYRVGTVTESTVNLRSGPGAGYSIVAYAEKDTPMTIVGEGKDVNGVTWYHTYLKKGSAVFAGYMTSKYIETESNRESDARAAEVDADVLNVRQGAGTTYSIIKQIPRNQVVHIVDYVTSAAGQTWAVVTFEVNGIRYTGCVSYAYLNVPEVNMRVQELCAEGMDDHIFYMAGNPSAAKKFTQTLAISGKAGDSYAGNLWGYREGAFVQKDNRAYGLEVEFVAADGTKEAYVSNFKSVIGGWEFLNDVFVAKKDYVKINVSCVCNYQGNMAAFDGLGLFREDFAQSYTYDAEGNVISVQNHAKKLSNFEYDDNDNLKKLIDPKGSAFQYTYDTSHNVTEALSAQNVKYTFKYDVYGNPTESRIVNPENAAEYIASTAGYTADGNYMEWEKDPLGNKISYEYDTYRGVLDRTVDGMGYSTAYTHDCLKRLEKVSKSCTQGILDGTAEVSYIYEKDSLKQIQHNGFAYTFKEDGFGNSTEIQIAGKLLVHREYEEYNGNLLSERYGNGYTYLYEYDSKDRVTEIRMKNAGGNEYVLYRYQYDKEGNLAVEYDIREDTGQDPVVTRYFYDLSGRLACMKNSAGEEYSYIYDLNDNLIKVNQGSAYRRRQTEYIYDKDNRESSVKAAEKTYSTEYDALGRVSRRVWNTAQPYTVSYTYKSGADGSRSALVEKETNGNREISYKYDKNGNITEITTKDGSIRYAYDELNQLVREDDSPQNCTVCYVYDMGCNILEKRIYAYLPDKTLDELKNMEPVDRIVYTYDAEWKDLLVSYDGQAITYDAIGNPLQYRGMAFSWSNGKELSTVTKNGKTTAYQYSKEGIRNRKDTEDGSVIYQIQDSRIAGEQRIGTTSQIPQYELEFFYDSAGNILSMRYNGSEYYYVKNGQGDVTGIINSAGTEVVSYQYDSWGRVLEVSGDKELGEVNPFRYRGYYYDTETGLYYVSSRYYDPETARFILADTTQILTATPMGLTDKNLYAYCDNNPVSRRDENGQLWQAIVIGAAVNVVTSYIAAKVTGQEYTWIDAGIAAASGAISGAVNWGVYLGGALSAIYTGVISYKNGAGLTGAVISGAAAGLSMIASISNLASCLGNAPGLATTAALDLVFGTAYSSAAAATVKGFTDNTQQKGMKVQTIPKKKQTSSVKTGGKPVTTSYKGSKILYKW